MTNTQDSAGLSYISLVVRLRTSVNYDVYPAMSEAADAIEKMAAVIDRLEAWADAHVSQLPTDEWSRGYQYAVVRAHAELKALRVE